MTPEIMVPQSVGVTLFAFGMVVGAALFGGVCWLWSGARSHDTGYRRGYHQAWQQGHEHGWVQGVSDAGVLDRLVALDTLEHDAEFQREALMRRYRGAIEAWIAEGRKWA